MKNSEAPWSLYLVRTRAGALYTGIATDTERRLAEHRQGKGSKYLRSRGPLELVYQIAIGNRSLALRAEGRFKKLAKANKETVVATSPDREKLLALLAISSAEPKDQDIRANENSRED